MTSSQILSHSEAFLLKRNSMLQELWELDEELRAWHQERVRQEYKPTEWNAEVAERVARRREVSDNLRGMRCKPWHFSPRRDNSWLAIQRAKVSTGTQ